MQAVATSILLSICIYYVYVVIQGYDLIDVDQINLSLTFTNPDSPPSTDSRFYLPEPWLENFACSLLLLFTEYIHLHCSIDRICKITSYGLRHYSFGNV